MQAPSPQELAALAVVLDHPVLAADHLLLCSAARVCVSWQEAVAASGAGTTHVTLDSSTVHPFPEGPRPTGSELEQCLLNYAEHYSMLRRRLQGLPAWMARHAHLVHGLRLSGSLGCCAADVLAESCEDFSDAATCLRLPRLKQFSADRDVTPALQPKLLAALPDGLSELKLAGISISRDDPSKGSHLTELLQRLRQLKVLHIKLESCPVEPLDLSPLRGLCHLTRLKLSGNVERDVSWRQQPVRPITAWYNHCLGHCSCAAQPGLCVFALSASPSTSMTAHIACVGLPLHGRPQEPS